MLTVIGCGNPNRSDDGAGVAVAQRLMTKVKDLALPDVRVFDAGTAGMEVMFLARGSRRLVIVDASANGSTPGSIFEVPGAQLATAPRPGQSLHAFRWDNALYAGKKIFREEFPTDVTVYLIEGQSLELGVGLSPAVDAAVERVVDLVVRRILDGDARVRVRGGSLYLHAALYERYFGGAQAIAVVGRGARIALVPLREPGSGGLLVKVRNVRGDRVIHASELLRELGVDDTSEYELSAEWDGDMAALTIANPAAPSAGAGAGAALAGGLEGGR